MQNMFIGRQVNYDRSMGVYAYELLYRKEKAIPLRTSVR